MTKTHLSLRDALLALAIVFVWGTNFVVIRVGLDALPPLFFAALRFAFTLPAIFFLPRPGNGTGQARKYVSWANLALYGIAVGLFQFGLLYVAMNGMIAPGLASLVVQMQAFFTVGLSLLLYRERVAPHQIAAFVLAMAGMAVIAAHNGSGITLTGLLLVLASAMGWATHNLAAKDAVRRTGQINMLAYIVWASLFAVPPLLALSLVLEGPGAILAGLHHATLLTWSAVLWQSVGNTMFGYACWAWLLSRYPAATISPLSLLVPVFGFAASAILLGEPMPLWKIGATLLIMCGLAVNLLWRPRKAMLAGEPD